MDYCDISLVIIKDEMNLQEKKFIANYMKGDIIIIHNYSSLKSLDEIKA